MKPTHDTEGNQETRLQALQAWLLRTPQAKQGLFQSGFAMEPASADASFRRYFRVWPQTASTEEVTEAAHSMIVMDAPPDKESVTAFVALSEQLDQLGLKVPRVLAKNVSEGFLLLTDLGQHTLWDALQALEPSQQTAFADRWYQSGLATLVRLQTHPSPLKQTLPVYDAALLAQEMDLFADWLVVKHLDGTPWTQASASSSEAHASWQQLKRTLIDSAAAQPQTVVHRDYHSRNLMMPTAHTDRPDTLGVLDFQDAVLGPCTYDGVSLLKDCYLRWPRTQIEDWLRWYFLASVEAGLWMKKDWADCVRAFDLMGLQRHLKAAGIFARLYHRDAKAGYLKDLPNTLLYLHQTARSYAHLPGVSGLLQRLDQEVLPAMESLR